MKPTPLNPEQLAGWLALHPGWRMTTTKPPQLMRSFAFPDFARALAFAVQVGELAEKRDHHPEILVRWGACDMTWWTHTASGVTALDLELSEATDALYTSLKAP